MMDDIFRENGWFLQRVERTFPSCGQLRSCRFEDDNGKVPQLVHARVYAQRWKEMCAKGLGLLFWGPPGTGKTFAAACIANSFLDSRDMFAPDVIMTDLGHILQHSMACTPQDREAYFRSLLDIPLLILDDFGMERQTEFAREQVYHLINGRYLAGLPLVLTTNLTLQQMKNPGTMAEHRIFDRVLELCVPVCFQGESLRREKAAENIRLYKSILAAGTKEVEPAGDLC